MYREYVGDLRLEVMGRMGTFLQIVLFFLVGYGGIVLFMFLRQESFIFFPVKANHEVINQPHIQQYSFEHQGVSLQGWLVNPQYKKDKLIIYYGGNAEDVFLNTDDFEAVQAATLFLAYRGYGPSEGTPGEKELFMDALAVIDDAIKRFAPEKVYLMGRSLGTGVACYVASKRTVDGIILVTPYDSVVAVAKGAYPWLPVTQLLRHRFESTEYVSDIRAPILVLYAGRDLVVRPERTRNLIQYLPSGIQVVLIPDADHGTIDMYREYWDVLLSFISQ